MTLVLSGSKMFPSSSLTIRSSSRILKSKNGGQDKSGEAEAFRTLVKSFYQKVYLISEDLDSHRTVLQKTEQLLQLAVTLG